MCKDADKAVVAHEMTREFPKADGFHHRRHTVTPVCVIIYHVRLPLLPVQAVRCYSEDMRSSEATLREILLRQKLRGLRCIHVWVV